MFPDEEERGWKAFVSRRLTERGKLCVCSTWRVCPEICHLFRFSSLTALYIDVFTCAYLSLNPYSFHPSTEHLFAKSWRAYKVVIQDQWWHNVRMCSCTNQPLITQAARRHEFLVFSRRASASVHYFLDLTRALSMQRHRLRYYLFTALSLSFHLSTNDGTPINNAYHQYIVVRKALCISKCQKRGGRAKGS